MIRRAQEKDIPKIHDLLTQVCLVHHNGRPDLFKKGARKYTDEQLKVMIRDDARPIFVYVDENDQVLGYAFCIFEESKDDNVLMDHKSLYVDDICVDENLRGQHIGQGIYEYVRNFAKESGCYNLTLNVWNCNPPAMKFYEACGLQPQKVHMEEIL